MSSWSKYDTSTISLRGKDNDRLLRSAQPSTLHCLSKLNKKGKEKDKKTENKKSYPLESLSSTTTVPA